MALAIAVVKREGGYGEGKKSWWQEGGGGGCGKEQMMALAIAVVKGEGGGNEDVISPRQFPVILEQIIMNREMCMWRVVGIGDW